MTKERAKELIAVHNYSAYLCLMPDGTIPPFDKMTAEEHEFIVTQWNKNPDGRSSVYTTLLDIVRGVVR